jgi:DcaP outer membrane protein
MKRTAIAALAAAALLPALASAQETTAKASYEIYGFAQLDYIQDFNRVDPTWDATLRPTRIPTVDGQFGSDGQAIFSVRQSRLGVKGSFPAGKEMLNAKLEFDFFGRGTDRPDAAGQSSIRLRRAYGEWGPILGGLTDSLFMDDDYWPNIVDYWGPSGMVFYRNVQIRYTVPLAAPQSFAVAIERPGSDLQAYPNELPDLASDNELPDLTARWRLTQRWGYLQVSGIARRLGYENLGTPPANGNVFGWGLNASSTVQLRPEKLKLLVAFAGGQGVANYWNDATPDVAAGGSVADPKGEAVGIWGLSAYVDVAWNKLLTSSFGYSTVRIDNTALQPAGAFKTGQYASGNVLVHPAANVLFGPELLWGQRTDNGGATGKDLRVQLSFKYSFTTGPRS